MEYLEVKGQSYRTDDEGLTEQMANFCAWITKETRIVDGLNTQSRLKIEGYQPKSFEDTSITPELVAFPEIEISAEEFPSLAWVMPNWGVRAVIRPGSGIKDDLRTYIQLRSKPTIQTIYRHTGWTSIEGKRRYIHAGGSIGADGNNKNATVRLPNELSKYDLTTDTKPTDGIDAVHRLLDVAEKEKTWPLLAATIAPIYGPMDFAIHLSGRTGTYKSELMSLYQSFYGKGMDSRNLPGSWSSTANALEALAFMACNAAFVIDDFVPQGTNWQVRSYQQNADKIIRAQGNQAGRARLTDTSNLQQTMYPRGVILSTGEDTPEGHSVRARMLILELAPGDISPEALTMCQKDRPLYAGMTAALISELATRPFDTRDRMEQLRVAYRDIGHSRTPQMLAKMVAICEHWIKWAGGIVKWDEKKQKALTAEAKASIEKAGAGQQFYLEDADPADKFIAMIRSIFAMGTGHVRTLNGGVPQKAELLGWIVEKSDGELPIFKSRGQCLGWVAWQKDRLWIDETSGFAAIKKQLGQDLAISKQTLFKRLKDSGYLKRVNDTQQRNTVRITADGHPRTVLEMSLTEVLDNKEVPNEEEE